MATKSPSAKGPAPKEKLRSIMEAASALTALGDEENPTQQTNEEATKSPKKDEKEPRKRYIPDHKKPDAALTFPEKVCH